MTTTTVTVTDRQIRTLRTEAVAAGDDAQVDLCDLATGHGPVTIDASSKEYDESDDCLALAVEQYIEQYPDLHGHDLSPTWGDDNRETIRLAIPQWHRDAARAECARVIADAAAQGE